MDIRIIHFDLDGVLADFRKGFTSFYGIDPDALSADEMWSRVASIPDFFLNLDVLDDGRRLLYIARYLGEARILTALPRKTTYSRAEDEKRKWSEANIGTEIPFVAVQFASQKAKLAKAGDILIDDSEKNVQRWVKAGGVGIVHKNFNRTAADLVSAFNIDRSECIRIAAELNMRLKDFKRLVEPDPSERDSWSPVVDQDTNTVAWYPKDKLEEYENWLELRFVLL